MRTTGNSTTRHLGKWLAILVAAGLTAGTAANAVPVDNGLRLWLDASNTSSLNGGAIADGAPVSAWNDVLVGDNTVPQNAVQGNAARQPIWRQSVAGLGGMSAVEFDGLPSNTNGDVMDIANLGFGNNISFFFVAENATQGGNTGSCCRPFFVGSQGIGVNPGYGFGPRRPGSGPHQVRADFPDPGDVNRSTNMLPGTVPPGGFQVYNLSRNGSASGGTSTSQNGVVLDRFTVTTDATDGSGNPRDTAYRVGADTTVAARHYKGRIAEIAAYDTTLSDVEVNQVGHYMEDKYNIGGAYNAPSSNLPVTSGLELWLDASNRSSIGTPDGSPLADGAKVAAWGDVLTGGNTTSHTAVQTSAARQPVWVESVPGLGGMSAVRFDGSSASGQGDRLGINAPLALGRDTTQFFVALDTEQTSSTQSCCRPLLSENTFNLNGNGHGFGFMRPGMSQDLHLYRGDTPTSRIFQDVAGSPDDAFHVYTIITDDDLRLDLDGFPLASAGSTFDNPTGTAYTIGGNVNVNARHYLGDIAEIIIFNRVLSPSEINSVGIYLESKYNIDTAYVPEPSTLLVWSLLAGLGIGLGWRRRK